MEQNAPCEDEIDIKVGKMLCILLFAPWCLRNGVTTHLAPLLLANKVSSLLDVSCQYIQNFSVINNA
jgi:hypothetical protein